MRTTGDEQELFGLRLVSTDLAFDELERTGPPHDLPELRLVLAVDDDVRGPFSGTADPGHANGTTPDSAIDEHSAEVRPHTD